MLVYHANAQLQHFDITWRMVYGRSDSKVLNFVLSHSNGNDSLDFSLVTPTITWWDGEGHFYKKETPATESAPGTCPGSNSMKSPRSLFDPWIPSDHQLLIFPQPSKALKLPFGSFWGLLPLDTTLKYPKVLHFKDWVFTELEGVLISRYLQLLATTAP